MLTPVLALAVAAINFGSSVDGRAPKRRPHALRQESYSPHINGSFTNVTNVNLAVSTQTGERNATAPLLYGWMFEDINHSGDGGIYGELLTNRAFQGSTSKIGAIDGIPGTSVQSSENPILPWGPVLTGWGPVGDVRLSLDLLHPLSDELPVVLEIDIPTDATGEVGIVNYGWWGIDVRPRTYNASFYVLANGPRSNNTLTGIDVKLRSNLTSDVWATSTIPISNGTISDFDYTQLSAQIINTVTAPNVNNSFSITMDGAAAAGNTFYIGLASLFGETYNGRPNGLRKDLAQHVRDLNPKFLRFPGGNNIEGYSIYERWKWYDTIGPLRHRKARVGDWGYINTNGLGLLEYLEWCEDLGMEPVLAVYAGFSLDVWGQAGTSYPPDRMQEVLQEVLDELEYCTGDTSTKYGAMRADHGHPDPFKINYIEIGNEDWFSSTYPYRFPFMYNGLKAAYPNITLISTAYNENPNYTITIPEGGIWDTHHYEEPSFFIDRFDEFDNWQQTYNTSGIDVFIGEYSVFQVDTPSGVVNFSDPIGEHVFYPSLLAAIGEAVYLLGAERNPNVVKLSSYAPSFQNLNWYNWTPNLVQFTSNWDETILSVSYYMQSMFARWRGTSVLPTTGQINPLFWVTTIDEPTGAIYLKVVNTGNSSIPLVATFDTSYSAVNGTILTNPDLNAFNYINNRTAVVPTPFDVDGQSGTSFEWDVPQWSITVLQFNP